MFDHPDDAGGRHRGHSSSSDAVDIRSPDWSAVDAMEQLRANDDDPRDDDDDDDAKRQNAIVRIIDGESVLVNTTRGEGGGVNTKDEVNVALILKELPTHLIALLIVTKRQRRDSGRNKP